MEVDVDLDPEVDTEEIWADMNLVVLCGRLGAPPEHRTNEFDAHLLRLLLTVRVAAPWRRIDVVPVRVRAPAVCRFGESWETGTRLWVVGGMHRVLDAGSERRTGRMEVSARLVTDLPEVLARRGR